MRPHPGYMAGSLHILLSHKPDRESLVYNTIICCLTINMETEPALLKYITRISSAHYTLEILNTHG